MNFFTMRRVATYASYDSLLEMGWAQRHRWGREFKNDHVNNLSAYKVCPKTGTFQTGACKSDNIYNPIHRRNGQIDSSLTLRYGPGQRNIDGNK